MLEVRTGCRLHFGLMELSDGAPLRFAGLGLMLAGPSFVLSFANCKLPGDDPTRTLAGVPQVECSEPARFEIAQRIEQVIELRRRWDASQGKEISVDYQVRVRQALPMHSGLGAGTQLACAVAAGLEFLTRAWAAAPLSSPVKTSGEPTWSHWQPLSQLEPPLTPRWLVQHAGRGLRSAVGLAGFLYGGLVLDQGYGEHPSRQLADRPLMARATAMPEPWRVVLIAPPTSKQQIHGGREAQLMEQLGHQPNRHAAHMLQLAERIHTAVQAPASFVDFVDALEPYMELGARLFSEYQQGLYNGAEITAAVEQARAAGLRGVGQSSWGPTVFGFAPSAVQAEHIAQRLSAHRGDWNVTVTKTAASGAEVRWLI